MENIFEKFVSSTGPITILAGGSYTRTNLIPVPDLPFKLDAEVSFGLASGIRFHRFKVPITQGYDYFPPLPPLVEHVQNALIVKIGVSKNIGEGGFQIEAGVGPGLPTERDGLAIALEGATPVPIPLGPIIIPPGMGGGYSYSPTGGPATMYLLQNPDGKGSLAVEAELAFVFPFTSEDTVRIATNIINAATDPEATLNSLLALGLTDKNGNPLTVEGIGLAVTEAAKDAGVFDKIIHPECFLAGTEIEIGLGQTKSIEHFKTGDEVFCYDQHNKLGDLVPGTVIRIQRNIVRNIVDFHELKMTPGHITLCGDGPFRGQHVPIIDILRSDGAVVDRDGNLIRAATNFPAGSPEDAFVEVCAVSRDDVGDLAVTDRQRVRAGTRVRLDDGGEYTLLERICESGGTVLDNGLVQPAGGGVPVPFLWAIDRIPNPEDYVLARSDLLLEEIYDAGEWEALGPMLPPPHDDSGHDGDAGRRRAPGRETGGLH